MARAAVVAAPPKHLYSVTHLIRIQRGNSFELATFLVCLLLGLGYNAYVASGYASREQSLCDQTKITCPYLPQVEEPPPPSPKVDTSKYRPKSPPDFRSKFIEGLAEAERQREQAEMEKREEERQRMIMELERPKADRQFGQRVHAWVILLPGGLGPRGPEITEPLFIETTTGVSYNPVELETANLYLGIESVWNNRNYWVNMQDCTEACSKLDLDLTNVSCWEHLLAGEPKEMRNVDEDEDEEVNIRRDFHMVMPASYIEQIDIPFDVFERRYPGGGKTIYYKKTKVDLFAPYVRNDGLVQSVTVYEDYEYNTPIYIYETFKNRHDNLERIEKNLRKELATDYYGKGRPDACKVHEYFINSKDTVDEERELRFYDKRLDELARIKMHPLYCVQDYKNRDDRLYNRFVEYSPFNESSAQTDIQNRMILKIVEKFHRNEDVPANKDTAIREYNYVENEIRLTYHYSEGQYTQATRSFVKPPVTERGDRLVFLPEMTHSYNPDPMATPEDFDDLIDELEKQLAEEDLSSVEVRNGENLINRFLQVRGDEFSASKLNVSLFDPIRNQEARTGLLAMEEKAKAQSQREIEGDANFLGPYMASLGDIKYLTKNQALKIRDNCINDFKQTMVDRANKILQDYIKYNAELEQLQTTLTHSEGLSKEEKEEILARINEKVFTLNSLEIRLKRHRELAPSRYQKLCAFLSKSRKISILYD